MTQHTKRVQRIYYTGGRARTRTNGKQSRKHLFKTSDKKSKTNKCKKKCDKSLKFNNEMQMKNFSKRNRNMK